MVADCQIGAFVCRFPRDFLSQVAIRENVNHPGRDSRSQEIKVGLGELDWPGRTGFEGTEVWGRRKLIFQAEEKLQFKLEFWRKWEFREVGEAEPNRSE